MSSYNYDSIPAGYYDDVFCKNSGIQSAWHHLKFSFISSLVPHEGLHADIGCGPGTFLGNFRRAAHSIGVDISSDQIDFATKKYATNTVAFVNSRSARMPFESNSLDSISLIEVIEHLDGNNISMVISESLRCLKPGGLFIVSTPNYSSMWPILEYFVNKFSKLSYEDQHITKLNTSKLTHMLSSQGLIIKRSGSFLLLSPFLAFFSWSFAHKFFHFESTLEKHNYGFLSYCVAAKSI